MGDKVYRKFVWAGFILVGILIIGTIGYWLLGARQYSLFDSFYMTFITIATIGYGEIVDLSHNPAGRVFTVFIAIAGIGVLGYAATSFSALLVEGELTKSFKRRRMENIAKNLKDHFVVCGVGIIGQYIAGELASTKRSHVIVEQDSCKVEKSLESLKNAVVVEGDATSNDSLLKAGIEQARGLFAVTGDDNQNLVICLTARQLNPNLRIVAECNAIANSGKMKRAGADAIVSPSFIGGLRMASEMIRPAVVSFLDIMLRDTDKNLRIEEIPVSGRYAEKTVSEMGLRSYRHSLLLAVKVGDEWVYNPADSYVIRQGNVLVFMTTPEGRKELEKII